MENKVISFNLREINTEQFAVLQDNYKENLAVNVKSDLNFFVHTDNRTLAVSFKCSFLQRNREFLISQIICHFEIQKKSWDDLKNVRDNSIRFPLYFARHLTILTIGTARGFLHAKTENTSYHKLIVPLLDTTKLVEKDISFIIPASDNTSTLHSNKT